MSNRLFKAGDIAFLDTSKSGKITKHCHERCTGQAVLCLGRARVSDKYHANPDIMNFYCFKTNMIFPWFCSWMHDA